MRRGDGLALSPEVRALPPRLIRLTILETERLSDFSFFFLFPPLVGVRTGIVAVPPLAYHPRLGQAGVGRPFPPFLLAVPEDPGQETVAVVGVRADPWGVGAGGGLGLDLGCLALNEVEEEADELLDDEVEEGLEEGGGRGA